MNWDYRQCCLSLRTTTSQRMEKAITLRRASAEDIPEIKALFRETVLNVNIKHYTADEVADWAACGEKPGHWETLVSSLHFTIATNAQGRIVGFAAWGKHVEGRIRTKKCRHSSLPKHGQTERRHLWYIACRLIATES